MHVYFSGIGGTAIGPLAQIAYSAGYQVSGSDKQTSQYIDYLKSHGIDDISIGQTQKQIAEVQAKQPIDWFVYSSAVSIEQPDSDEFKFCDEHGIKTSKRDEFINHLIKEKSLKLLAVAGTHGKTTTTAMMVWLLKQLKIPVTYSVGAKISFGDMGEYDPDSEYFVLEADEFDRNFLAFNPFLSIITGVDYDHHEIFPTREDYVGAFRQFIEQSSWQVVWQHDADHIGLGANPNLIELNIHDDMLSNFTLLGEVNRQNAWQVVNAVQQLVQKPLDELIEHMNKFPGLNRRFERIAENIYSDYAHTETKIRGALQTAQEVSQNVVVVYEPLTNRRQHYIKDTYKDLFTGVKKLYWVPSYLAREDPDQHILTPAELIETMANQDIAEPAQLNSELKKHIEEHQAAGDTVLCISGGGGGSLDEWLRKEFRSPAPFAVS